MILIILLHSLSYGGVRELYQYGEIGYVVMNILRGFAYIGVNCFVMLSGWFMCDSAFRFKRIVSVWLQVFFYGIVSFGVSIILTNEISFNSIISVFFPVTGQSYWFVSCYFLLLFLQPLLNFVVNRTDEKQLKRFVITLILLFSVLPTFLPWSKSFTSSGTDIMWFISIYMFMAYLKKYGERIYLIQKKSFGWLLFFSGVITGVALDFLANGILSILNHATIDKLFYYNNSLMFFIAAVGLFIICKNMNCEKMPRFILIPASATFGIYLLHDNPLVRNFVWSSLERILPLSPNIAVNVAFCAFKVVLIFVVGMTVDLVRQFLFNKFKMNVLSEKADKLFRKICDNI